MSRRKTAAVVIPAHNEAPIIASVLANIPAEIRSHQVIPIVIDDGSDDDTSAAARGAGAIVIRHLTNLGVGAATTTGFRAAQEIGADIIVTMDADGQHDPREITTLVECLLDGPFDVVIGSRLLMHDGMPPLRFAANLVLNGLTFLVYGKIVSDSQSGFKAFTRGAIDRMELNCAGYEICSEMVGEIYRKNFRYKSIPVCAVYTPYSRAKGQPFLNGVNLILGLFMRLVRR
ncbi:MAG TPA: glycosyltransferase family 2 protein [Terriglobia bacterium]|jgi:glycosyltransferase involved in cell wall biosynthesis